MKSRKWHRDNGYTIDSHCYPNVAYKDGRFAPDVIVNVMTEREEELQREVKRLTRNLKEFYED